MKTVQWHSGNAPARPECLSKPNSRCDFGFAARRQQKENLMTIDAIRSVAIRCQPRIADALDRLTSSEPSTSARIDAEADFRAAMAGFAAAETVAPGNVPEPYPVGAYWVAWDRNQGLWHVLDSDGNARSWDASQEVVERHALEATVRLKAGVADCSVCGQPMTPGGAAVSKPTPQGWVRCAPADAGARHDDCIAKPTPQLQNQQQGSSAPDLNREQVLAWIREHGLAGADLQAVDLNGAYLRNADLTRADLGDARLPYANLSDADLTGADFAGAIFDSAQLQYADLSRAELDDGTLTYEEMAHFLAALHHAADADMRPPPAGETQ